MKILKGLFEILFPKSCVLCLENKSFYICFDCRKKLIENKSFCRICAMPFLNGQDLDYLCSLCRKRKTYFDKIISPYLYDDFSKHIIFNFKYNKKWYLASEIADLILNKVKIEESYDFVTFVPMYKKKEKERGFNQSLLLAKEIAKRLRLKCISSLIKLKDTPSQTELPRKEKLKNLKGCFALKTKIPLVNKKIILVDDVVTTGTTANQISKELKKGGVKEILVLSFLR